jgi:hypothetical protein
MPLVLSPLVAANAEQFIPADTTFKKYEVVQDHHNKEETTRLLQNRHFNFAQDSGKKQDVEHHIECISSYFKESDVVYLQLLGVRAVPSTKGVDLAQSQLLRMAEFGLNPMLQQFASSDTCASIVGQNSSDLSKSKGLIERVRQETKNILVKHIPCLNHCNDLALRAGLVAMVGEDQNW